MTEVSNAVVIEQLHKHYGTVHALDGVTLSVPHGSIFGLLGPNGAGKTTAVRILLGLARATSGQATVLGNDAGSFPTAQRKRVGYLPDVPGFYPWMTAPEWMAHCADLVGLRGAEAAQQTASLLEMAGLAGIPQRVGGYSRGMRQRLGLASALIGSPELLILDEPTSALDPIGRHHVLDLLASLRGRVTVLLSTHLLADVERVCDHLAVIDRGRTVLSGTAAEVRASHTHAVTVRLVLDVPPDGAASLRNSLTEEPWCTSVRAESGALLLGVSDIAASRRRIPALVSSAGRGLVHLEELQPSLEEVFLDVVGEPR